ncbi:MAG TPA: GTPase domain-containing protein, partial [Myxococcota bacterium]|nr:GTPase domain-containing protein [Myxococcota bacterium]
MNVVGDAGAGVRTVVLSLVSHTNVGKTTLARTLLRREVGEVFDHAHVTEETERFVLLETAEGDRVVLADNPGFGDSARLLGRLRGLDNPVGWLIAQVWDRFTDRPLYCSQQAVLHVRDEADVVLYLVNASEDPDAAGYVAPELEILGWIGRPVVVLLNQTGVAGDAAARAGDLARWRAALASRPVVRETVALDAFTRCWVQEGLLFEKLRDLVPEDRRDLLEALLRRWREEQLAVLRGSVEAMAELVAFAAADAEAVTRSAFGAAERRRAAQALARRLENAMAEANDALIAGHGLTGEAAEELRVELADVSGGEAAGAAWRNPMMGGLVGGALGGLVADVAHGGLTLGGGMLAGALLGAAGARGLAVGMELLRGESASRAVWSVPFLERLCTDTLLRYLAVAHFGRGAGQYRVREHPAVWRAVAERALAPQRGTLREAFARARKESDAQGRREAAFDCAPPLASAARAALTELYP